MGKTYFDPATVTLEEVIKRTLGANKEQLYGDNFKMEDHPSKKYVQINISDPSNPKGHISFDIPYDENGKFGKAVKHR